DAPPGRPQHEGSVDGIKKVPHPEAAAKQTSRRTHRGNAADSFTFSAPVLVRREGGQRQCMDPRRELVGQGLIGETLSRDACLASKGSRGDCNRKMALTLRPGTRVPGVTMRLVLDLKPERSEPGRQLLANGFGDAHDGEEIRVGDSEAGTA